MTSVLDGRVGSRTVENAKSGNPSSRRDGIIILFECEHCDSDIQLALRISQHKGETTIGWSYTPKDQT